jgi:hypothetical protein
VSLIAQKFFTIGAKVQAGRCRAAGMTDSHVPSVFDTAVQVGRQNANGDATDEGLRLAFFSRLDGLAIDPATIMLIVQLCLLIYKALKAAGYFEQAEGFQSVANAKSIIGEI